MPFRPEELDRATLKRLAKHLHRAWTQDVLIHRHPQAGGRPEFAYMNFTVADDRRYWSECVRAGISPVIRGLQTLNHLAGDQAHIKTDDGEAVWAARWAALIDQAIAVGYAPLAVLATWIQRHAEYRSTEDVGVILARMLSVQDPQEG